MLPDDDGGGAGGMGLEEEEKDAKLKDQMEQKNVNWMKYLYLNCDTET